MMVFCRGCGKQLHETAPSCPNCGAPQAVNFSGGQATLSQTAAGLWCIFLGGFGAHWFYLRKTGPGVLFLIFCWTGIPALFSFFNGLHIAFASPEEWAKLYNNDVRTEPVSAAIKILAVALPILGVIFWIAVFSAE